MVFFFSAKRRISAARTFHFARWHLLSIREWEKTVVTNSRPMRPPSAALSSHAASSTNPAPEKLKVLVVDDSATVRQVMQAILQTDQRISVSAASDPLITAKIMQIEHADVGITEA